MHPCVCRTSEVDRLDERIERARVDVSRLECHDRRSIPADRQGGPQCLRIDASLIVGLHQFGLAEPQVAQRQVDGHMPVLAGHDPYGWPTCEPVASGVPACTSEHRVSSGRETCEVRHRRAGGKTDGARRR